LIMVDSGEECIDKYMKEQPKVTKYLWYCWIMNWGACRETLLLVR
jgi:hypothetical protein